jgi:hypothetical protein
MNSLRLMVLVHPGSLCASADFNIGSDDAAAARKFVQEDLDDHQGHLIVLDGYAGDGRDLANEVDLSATIDRALDRAAASGFLSERLFGPSDRFERSLPRRARKLTGEIGSNVEVVLTGAWSDVAGGCVTTAAEIFRSAGYADVSILTSSPSCETDYPAGFADRLAAFTQPASAF